MSARHPVRLAQSPLDVALSPSLREGLSQAAHPPFALQSLDWTVGTIEDGADEWGMWPSSGEPDGGHPERPPAALPTAPSTA